MVNKVHPEPPTCVFKGKRIAVYVGSENDSPQREVVVHPGAAVILPILNDNEVILIRNERFVVNDTIWELPAGTLEPHEEPIKCAYRELIEETGYKAKRIEPLFSFYPSPGFCDEIMHLFCAYDLEFVGQNLDPNEKIEVVPITWDKALQLIYDGEIIDSKTIAGLLYYNTWKRKSIS